MDTEDIEAVTSEADAAESAQLKTNAKGVMGVITQCWTCSWWCGTDI